MTAVPSLHIFYRSSGGDNRKDRPPYYSKRNSLLSFLRAYAVIRDRATVAFVNDGEISDDRRALMYRWGEIVQLGGIGNTPSHLATLRLAVSSASPLVYFAEDDYLYTELMVQKRTIILIMSQ